LQYLVFFLLIDFIRATSLLLKEKMKKIKLPQNTTSVSNPAEKIICQVLEQRSP